MEEIMEILKLIGAILTLIYGIVATVRPEAVANASSMKLEGKRGRAEMRIAQGGFFTGMGLWALLLQEPEAYAVLGAAWLGGGIVRVLSYFLDQPKLDNVFIGLGILELAVGLILIIPT